MANARDDIEKFRKAGEAAKQFNEDQSRISELETKKGQLNSRYDKVTSDTQTLANSGLESDLDRSKLNDLVQEGKHLQTQITTVDAELNALKQPTKEASKQYEATNETFKQDYKDREGKPFDAPSSSGGEVEKPKHALDDKTKAQANEAVSGIKEQQQEEPSPTEQKPVSNSPHVEAAKKEAEKPAPQPSPGKEQDKVNDQDQDR